MSVLIRGMKMPSSCFDCPISHPAYSKTIGCGVTGKTIHAPDCEEKRMADCPLVPVPPHGDLIEREYAIATACSGRIRALPTTEDGEDWIRVEEVRESIKNAPTIIPASEGGET